MQSSIKEQLVRMINESSEEELSGLHEMALKLHLASLQKQRKQVEREIAKARKQLEGVPPAPKKPTPGKPAPKKPTPEKPAVKLRSGPRVTDVIRQTLRDAGSPLPLSRITEAVAKTTNRALTGNLRSYVAQLLRREPTVRRLSRGLYGISV